MDNDVKRKIDSVEQNIDRLARKLADKNVILEGKLRTEIKEIVIQDNLSTSDKASSLLRILSEEGSVSDPELIVRAKEASLEVGGWDIELVRAYRGENFTENLVKETIKDNPGITEAQVKTVRSLGDNINTIYHSNGGVENQIDEVDTSSGKATNAWDDTQGINGLLKQKPKRFRQIIDNHEKITTDLQTQNIKLPYQRSSKLASYDRVMSSFKNPEMRRFIESARSRFQTLERLTNGRFSQFSNNIINRIGGDRLRNVANNFFNKSIVNISNGFASKIGNQAARNFVQNTMGSIMKDGLGQGMKTAMQGVMKKGAQLAGKAAMNVAAKLGLKAGAMALKTALGAALGAATAGIGTAVMAALEGLKMVGQFFGNLFKGLGLELTNNKFADTAIVVVLIILVLSFGMNTATADVTSSLVPKMEGTEGSLFHGEITYTEDGRIKDCGVGMEVNFNRRSNTPLVTPNVLSTGIHDRQLEEYIGDAVGTPCGVVYAAHYLAYDFEYWVPYWLTGSWPRKGLNPQWGKQTVSDWNGHREGPLGLDCGHFRNWAWVNGGFSAGMNNKIPNIPFGNCERIKAAIEPGDGLYMDNPPSINGKKTYSHSAIVLAYDDNRIKFAHAGGSSGVTTGWISICTGLGIGNGNHFEYLQKKAY